MEDIQVILQAMQTFGLWVVFAWLYIDERRQHIKTRQEMSDRIRDAKNAHMEDLREVAGMRARLENVTALAQQHQALQRAHE